MQRDRKIIHIDMDAFYAAIEQRDRSDNFSNFRELIKLFSFLPSGVIPRLAYEELVVSSIKPERSAFKAACRPSCLRRCISLCAVGELLI